MAILGMDLGGTKLAAAVFSEAGTILFEETVSVGKRQGAEVGRLITGQVNKLMEWAKEEPVTAIGICVPGISHHVKGTVWVPNIPGWKEYPLKQEVEDQAGVPVIIDSDRACYILGESWKGAARGCTHAIYVSIGTGIGAGIMVNGAVLRGAHGTAGSLGWLALETPYDASYTACGCSESQASGEGIPKLAKKILPLTEGYHGTLKSKLESLLTSHDILAAYEENDPVAARVIGTCIELWGMATANLVSIFDPEKIIIGGGVFGPAIRLIPAIRTEAEKWAQPVSFKQVLIEVSTLDNNAGLYGAGLLALQAKKNSPAHE